MASRLRQVPKPNGICRWDSGQSTSDIGLVRGQSNPREPEYESTVVHTSARRDAVPVTLVDHHVEQAQRAEMGANRRSRSVDWDDTKLPG